MTDKVQGELPDRSQVPQADTWDLSTIFASDADWEAEFSKLSASLPALTAFQGKLDSSAQTLLEALTLRDDTAHMLEKLYNYAMMRNSQDIADHIYQSMNDRVVALWTARAAATSFMSPELLTINQETFDCFMQEQPGLTIYKHQFADLNRMRSRLRSAEVEEAVAKAGELSQVPGMVRSRLAEADLKLPQILGPDGKPVQLTRGNFGDFFLDNPDRATRERGWRGMMEAHGAFPNSFAGLYSGVIKQGQFYAWARNYPSVVEYSLDQINVPVSFYHQLIETVHRNLPRLARYLELREKLLKVDELQLWDLYVPIVEGGETKYSRQEGIDLILKALQPLGDEYVSLLRAGLTAGRWVDWVENQNKTSGAYSGGTWGTNPFILMNTSDGVLTLDQVFTLAHEGGHSMHSLFTRRTQPYQYGDYTLFLAEMASTCNESLLHRHLLSTVTDKRLRQIVLNHALEGIRGTLFRQTLFAEFELEAHTHAENGEAITSELLGRILGKLYRRYYGSVAVIDPLIGDEWMRIPHFFNSPFYVWQYATGISAGSAFAKMILEEGEPARKRYLEFLSSGSSDYSTNLLLKAGIDFSTPAPVQAAIDEFEQLLELFEATFK